MHVVREMVCLGHLHYCRHFQQSYGFVLNGNAMIKYCDEEFNPTML